MCVIAQQPNVESAVAWPPPTLAGRTILHGRRSVFLNFVYGLFSAPSMARLELPERAISSDAQDLAAAMAALHGGLWKAVVDHEAGFILIRPVLDQLPPL